MHYGNLVSLLWLTTASHGLIIPADQPAGSYLVTRHEDSTEEHVPFVLGGQTDSAVIEKRDNERFWCGCGINMDHGRCDTAVQGLKNQIGSGTVVIKANQAWYSNTHAGNDVVAFICNRGGHDEVTNAGILTKLLQDITKKCGWYVPGTVYSSDSQLFYGYMNWREGLDFCTAATSSTVGKC